MEFNQATESFPNQYCNNQPSEQLYHNQSPPEPLHSSQPPSEPFFGQQTPSETHYGAPQSAGVLFVNPPTSFCPPAPLTKAAESFLISEVRKLETEKALWRKDQQILNKEISRLNDRVTQEVSAQGNNKMTRSSQSFPYLAMGNLGISEEQSKI